MTKIFRLGSRQSPLALAQTQQVADCLTHHWPDLQIEIKTFVTRGDQISQQPGASAWTQTDEGGIFVKELEIALQQDEIDCAIHSLKDMPGKLPKGLVLTSFGEREDPRDVLLSRNAYIFDTLPSGSVVGTGSPRRIAQLKRLRPNLEYRAIRGNLQTRYRKLETGEYDVLILAAAGVHRLGWQDRIREYLDPWDACIPAVGQGILGVEYRQGDTSTQDLLEPFLIKSVDVAQLAERAVLTSLSAGCQAPLGVYCQVDEDSCNLKARVLSLDGKEIIEAELSVDWDQPAESGKAMAALLLDEGAKQLLSHSSLLY